MIETFQQNLNYKIIIKIAKIEKGGTSIHCFDQESLCSILVFII